MALSSSGTANVVVVGGTVVVVDVDVVDVDVVDVLVLVVAPSDEDGASSSVEDGDVSASAAEQATRTSAATAVRARRSVTSRRNMSDGQGTDSTHDGVVTPHA